MRLLIPLLGVVTLVITACSPAGPLTPEDAFNTVRKALMMKDYRLLEESISRSSRARVAHSAGRISSMPLRQKEKLARAYGLTLDRGSLSIQEYLRMQFRKEFDHPALYAVTRGILRIDYGRERSTVYVEGGFPFVFVKEGPYWKYELPE